MKTTMKLPETQSAVQLTGPDVLTLNSNKPVSRPGPTQLLMRVEAVGLCFSDLKLLKQFSGHARKSPVLTGIRAEILKENPSYAPGELPVVPGHEAVGRIVAVGDDVHHHRLGERVLIQADWRYLRTAQANGAFGYNFEGGLQEYVLLDERIIIDPETRQRYLLPVGEACGASALALVEPWACVEHSYVTDERRSVRPGGRLLVVVAPGCVARGLASSLSAEGKPGSVIVVAEDGRMPEACRELNVPTTMAPEVSSLPDRTFDDIIVFGARADTIEALNKKLAEGGLFNIVQCGHRFGRPVSVDVGRVHYGSTRWCGTTGDDASVGYSSIPTCGEVRDGDTILVVGAAGPMGQMHVIRALCCGARNLTLVASDIDTLRLKSLNAKVSSLAETSGVAFRVTNQQEIAAQERFTYTTLMAPVAGLVAQAVVWSDPGGRINIFAGIPTGTSVPLDLDAYVARRLWMFGTSGSTIDDMQLVLKKVESGQLDTDCSVGAVSGVAGAIDGIRAVEGRTVSGKIVVYPALKRMGLCRLDELALKRPAVGALLRDGAWTKAAEEELLASDR